MNSAAVARLGFGGGRCGGAAPAQGRAEGPTAQRQMKAVLALEMGAKRKYDILPKTVLPRKDHVGYNTPALLDFRLSLRRDIRQSNLGFSGPTDKSWKKP